MLHKGCEGGITGKSAIKTTVPPQLPGVEGVDLPIDPHIAALPSISSELVNGGEFRASRCIAGLISSPRDSQHTCKTGGVGVGVRRVSEIRSCIGGGFVSIGGAWRGWTTRPKLAADVEVNGARLDGQTPDVSAEFGGEARKVMEFWLRLVFLRSPQFLRVVRVLLLVSTPFSFGCCIGLKREGC